MKIIIIIIKNNKLISFGNKYEHNDLITGGK
jgi:hypothetical protein